MTHPHAFHGAPRLTPGPQPQPARVVQVPGSPSRPAILTIDPRGDTYLSMELCRVLGKAIPPHRGPIDLRPPSSRNGGMWRLDVRPCASRHLSVPAPTAGNVALPRFKSSYILSPRLFRVYTPAAGKGQPARPVPGQLYARIALELVGPDPNTPGLYLLRPSPTHSTISR